MLESVASGLTSLLDPFHLAMLMLGLMAFLVFALFMFERFLEVFWLEGLLNQWLQKSVPWLF